jgi:hypothetical protein
LENSSGSPVIGLVRLEYDDGALYRGTYLVRAQEWASDHQANLNDLE